MLIVNNASCKIVGIRIVQIKITDGVVKTLGRVRYVRNLKRNTIFFSILDSKGFKYISGGEVFFFDK